MKLVTCHVAMTSRRLISKQLFFVWIWTFLGITAPAAQSRSVGVLSDADLVAKSDVVVTGRVAKSATGLDDGTIYTYLTVDMATGLKAGGPTRRIVFKRLAGGVA